MTDWDARYREGEHVGDEPHPLLTGFAAKLALVSTDVACGPGRMQYGSPNAAGSNSRRFLAHCKSRFSNSAACEKGLVINAVLADLERHDSSLNPNPTTDCRLQLSSARFVSVNSAGRVLEHRLPRSLPWSISIRIFDP